MALAGVTGGEVRIKDVIPDDLRMIRLVFERIGLQSMLDGADVVVPAARRSSSRATSASTSPRSRTARGPRSRPT
jgi:UDP-N-acetylglucosamine enolpyruvyl transferase